MSSATLGTKCNNFQPHHLRPDKCLSCFGDAQQHANGSSKMDLRSGGDPSQLSGKRDSSLSEKAKTEGLAACNKCEGKDDELERLKREIGEWQSRCRTAEQANQKTRDELRLLENEMEEMHDNFKEEESEQFEQVKQELDAALKNCKILQIRLNKSERQYSQLEQVKIMLEKQLEESQQQDQLNDSSHGPKRPASGEQLKLYEMSGDFVKVPTGEYDQLLRDLNDTSERERDLQEQIKYSQEEAQVKGERLQAVEAENEILLGRINKLTQANSNLRSSLMSSSNSDARSATERTNISGPTPGRGENVEVRDLCEQNEQLKLALEVLQSECERLKARNGELQQTLEMKERTVLEISTKLSRLGQQAQAHYEASGGGGGGGQEQSSAKGRFELECRQLRARLAHSERECRQLRSQLEMMSNTQNGIATSNQGRRFAGAPRSQSMESAADGASCQSSKCQESTNQLEKQCRSLLERNQQLETKLQRFIEFSNQDLDQKTNMESDLFANLKRQLETNESELAKAKSRSVELDIECGRAQRQYKRLLNSLESCRTNGTEFTNLRRHKLPADEAARDTLSRQELRQAMRDLELDIEDLMGLVKAKECLLKEQQLASSGNNKSPEQETGANSALQDGSQTSEQQIRSLRRLVDQEQLLSNNLKLDVANLERNNAELATRGQMLEREREAMEEELEKLRQLSGEFRAELEESQREKQMALGKTRELIETVERLRLELNEARQQQLQQNNNSSSSSPKQSHDALLMARDLSELKVKNGFLMRQLEMAREDSARQLEEVRTSAEAQLRRALELAQLELKERHFQETQQLREDLNDSKQKLASLQRQAARQEEESNLERDRVRAVEREWRRDKSQWQQTREQLEGQLAIEKRSSEFRLKAAEAAIRDKERQLINMQDRCVQLERDLKRLQNKFHLLEEDSESRVKQLARDLEMRTKELNEIGGQKQARDEQQFEMLKRLQGEKATLKETLDTLGRSYDEKLVEARQLKELLHSRQEQSYKERSQQFERIEALTRCLNEMSQHESQAKLLKQRLEMQERQLESQRRDLLQLREERTRLKTRCEELEKRELITKTSSISGSSASFFKPFSSPRAHLIGSARTNATESGLSLKRPTQQQAVSAPTGSGSSQPDHKLIAEQQQQQQSMVEKLSGKINDQRNLINILRQQLNETQMELKQLKLLQSGEKSKWQTRLALLTGRLNECEEKLAYETLMLSKSPALIDQLARPKLEMSWTQERKANLDLIHQQQSQIEMLAKDLKKTSQAHDLLRLQSKQLESHNNKLSKRLIEYQQQSNIFRVHDRELELNYDRLLRKNAQMSQEMRPMLQIVGKIIASLDAPEQQQQQQSQARPGSTDRPLRAGSMAARAERALDSDDSTLDHEFGPVPPPAHQMAASNTSRLTRLLAGGSKQAPSADQDIQKTSAKKAVKRVRVKCSTLGITTSEKKHLKQHLKALDEAFAWSSGERTDKCGSSPSGRTDSTLISTNLRTSAEAHEHCSNSETTKGSSEAARCKSQTRASAIDCDQSSQQSSHASRVHWQADSDLESESSFSIGADMAPQRQDLYRRFPQTSPASVRGHSLGPPGVSLTDYESESSLASDYSPANFSPSTLLAGRRAGAPSGAESDSGLAGISFSTASSSKSSGRKLKSSSGFKGRLTNTLRNISRSITGGLGGSDTEESNYKRERPNESERNESKKRPNLKEIRV